ncbi:MAG: sugar ABC transporter ATP-binding protein [Spirochaetaceae bacterium]
MVVEENLLELENVSKSFPGVKALDGVNFDLRKGEVHALLGENGAGKSTLMKIISGVYKKDGGFYRVLGKEVGDLTPHKAAALGIAIIHQELNLCEHLTVAENIFLGREDVKWGVLSKKEMNRRTKIILDDLKVEITPETIISHLPISKKQMVEIAKSLSTNAKVLIMDEPTSALTDKEIEDLFRIIKDLRSKGVGIVYISHRLEELEHITDRISIFRDGKYIITKNYEDTSIDEIISFMVGREIKDKFPKVSSKKGKKILEVKNLNSGIVKNASFDLYEGEILGVSGLMGAGRTQMVRAIFGAERIESGEIILDGKILKIHSPHNAISRGIVLGPEDRKLEGLCTKLSIKENIGIANIDKVTNRFGVINRKRENVLAEKVVNNLKVKTPSIEKVVQNLSGGNQQKVVVGKWMVRNARVVIFDEPTRGIDVAAKVSIYEIMNQLKQAGIAVLFVSSEMPEILGMSDRTLVMCHGKITGDLITSETNSDEIMYYATKI